MTRRHAWILVLLLGAAWRCPLKGQVLEFQDVVSRPGSFDGKKVTIRATYRFGFEWQELYCLPFRPSSRVWLAISPEVSTRLRRQLARLPRSQGTVNANFTGVFHGVPSAFGDGAYQHQLDLEKGRESRLSRKAACFRTGCHPLNGPGSAKLTRLRDLDLYFTNSRRPNFSGVW